VMAFINNGDHNYASNQFHGGLPFGTGNLGGVDAEGTGWHGQPFSAEVTLPPLGAIWLVPEAG